MKNILVFGGTGMLGKPVTEALFAAGHQVTVASRGIPREDMVTQLQWVRADLKDKETIRKALEGQEYVYLNLSVTPGERKSDFHTEGQGIRNLLDVVNEPGRSVRRISYLSSYLMEYETDWWVFEVKRAAAAMLKEAKVATSIFYPSTFMETISEKLLTAGRIPIMGKSKYPMWWIAAEDYMKMVVADFELEEEGSREWYVQGPEAWDMMQAAKLYAQNYTVRRVKPMQLPMWMFKSLTGLSSTVRYGVRLSEAINNFKEEFRGQPAWDQLHKPETTLIKFAADSSKIP